MIVLPPDIILDKPINEASYLDYCKGVKRQRSLKEMREASLAYHMVCLEKIPEGWYGDEKFDVK